MISIFFSLKFSLKTPQRQWVSLNSTFSDDSIYSVWSCRSYSEMLHFWAGFNEYIRHYIIHVVKKKCRVLNYLKQIFSIYFNYVFSTSIWFYQFFFIFFLYAFALWNDVGMGFYYFNVPPSPPSPPWMNKWHKTLCHLWLFKAGLGHLKFQAALHCDKTQS